MALFVVRFLRLRFFSLAYDVGSFIILVIKSAGRDVETTSKEHIMTQKGHSTAQKSICYLICVFNDANGLARSLESIYQDDPLADIVVVDDGSATPIKPHQPPAGWHLHLITLPENKGLITALNTGLDYILTKPYHYIARLDAGDTVNKGRLKRQQQYLDTHRKVGMVGTQLRAFDQKTGDTLFHFNNPIGQKRVAKTLKIKNCIAHPSVMIRSDVFRKVGLYDHNAQYAEDYEMWRRIENSFAVDNLPDICTNKEISDTQMTATSRRASTFSKLKTQIKYFKWDNIWCYAGLVRTLVSLLIPRRVLLFIRSNLSSVS